jgi:hypothetical protein
MDIRCPLKKLQECFMAEGHKRSHNTELNWVGCHLPIMIPTWVELSIFNEHVTR